MVLFIECAVVSFESPVKIPWCDHSNETSSAVLSYGTIYYVVLTFESVDKISRCDHSNETYLTVLSRGTICFSAFNKMKFGIFCLILTLATSVSKEVRSF